MGWPVTIARCADAVLELAMPRRCAGCATPGDALCALCALDLRDAMAVAPFDSVPDPAPTGFPPTWSAAAYSGVLPHLITAYKDRDRTDLAPLLSAWWHRAFEHLLAHDQWVGVAAGRGEPVHVVCAPSSAAARRRRGRDPLGQLVRSALREDPAVRVLDGLGFRRRVRDQATLGSSERAANLAGAVRIGDRLAATLAAGGCWVVADDVVTTGATVAEVARALRAAGAGHVAAATIAATPRRAGGRPGPRAGTDPSAE